MTEDNVITILEQDRGVRNNGNAYTYSTTSERHQRSSAGAKALRLLGKRPALRARAE